MYESYLSGLSLKSRSSSSDGTTPFTARFSAMTFILHTRLGRFNSRNDGCQFLEYLCLLFGGSLSIMWGGMMEISISIA